ncbi:Cytochrome P450 6B4 [Papilio xuthus]|uniref:unspecific monooxygenase n=1 Tax=Papilio xuthus TaxID=66420 RepID=A0A194Q292_PAPXU|nr:Cytochrome P450 6B4 [Papilio xuthus]
MTTPCLLLRDLDVIKHVMVKDFDQFVDRGIAFSKEGLGLNFFNADTDTWKVLRNRFTPLFTSGKLKNMLYLMTERGDTFLDYVENLRSKKSELPIHVLVQKFTMATISACAFGLDLDEDMYKTLNKIDKMIFTPKFSLELDMMYPGILLKLNNSIFPKFLKSFFINLVTTVINQRGGKPTNRKDFMDLLLELRQKKTIEGSKGSVDDKVRSLELTDDILAAQAFVFYAAGYETSASTMSYLFYELAKHPKIQDKVIAEIDEVLKRYNGEITYDCLNEMTYLQQVFDETLRKYPIVDPLQRNADMDYVVPGTNTIIIKGQTVLVSVLGIHRDPQYYPNPDKFDPERFNADNKKDRHTCAYLPFGTGPRNCIGMRFAKVQSQVCIVKFLSRYRVEPTKNTPTEVKFDPMRVVLFPIGGIELNILRR